ncbi:MAG: hypothetical protein AB2385_05980 [Symbiobacterium sp.]|mgnify:FL=1|uniref:hypothetical protein n=1 Tax=Symbiobacterium sp. TaxID=1971213 RepID=UPI0034649E0C
MEELVRTITESITEWIQSLGGSFISYVVDNIDNFNDNYAFGQFSSPSDFYPYRYNWLWELYKRVLFFSWAVLLFRLAADGVRTYLARETGELTVSPMVIFRRLVVTVVIMTITTYGFAYGHHGISGALGNRIKEEVRKVSRHPQRDEIYRPLSQWYPNMGNWLKKFKQHWVDAHSGGSSSNPGESIFRMTVALTVTMGILTFFVQQALREMELVFAWLVGPVVCLSAMSTDEPWRDGALALWLREVLVVSFNQVATMVVLIMMYETIDLSNLSKSGVAWRTMVAILALIAIGTQGPRALRHYAFGNQQGQMLASQLIRMPW